MRRTIVFHIILFLVLSAALAKPNRKPGEESSCPTIKGSTYTVEFTDFEGGPVLRITKSSGEALKPWPLPSLDFGVACKNLWYFPERETVILELFEGQSGQTVMTNVTTLFVYSLKKDTLSYVAKFPLEVYTVEGETREYSVNSTLVAPPRLIKGNVEFEIRDQLTKRTSKHTY